MKMRVARHTTALQPLIHFYVELLGLTVLGDFKDHDGYDGVFLGLPGENWHLEFTVSEEPAVHKADEDDLLVFYAGSAEEYQGFLAKAVSMNVPEVEPKNPYWAVNGKTFLDPDGFRLVITLNNTIA